MHVQKDFMEHIFTEGTYKFYFWLHLYHIIYYFVFLSKQVLL